jgi:hypothetical protein
MQRRGTFAKFLEDALKDYFATTPTRDSINDAFNKLKDKSKYATIRWQLDIIGDMSKKVQKHADDKPDLGKYAWKRHIDLDKEISKADERLRTEVTTRYGGGLSFHGVNLGARKEKHTTIRAI